MKNETIAENEGYFIYIRVSSTKQADGASLPAQKRIITEYALKHGLTIIKEFREVESAAKQGRTAFNKMLIELEHGHAKGVIFHKIDRGARDLGDWAKLLKLFKMNGVDVRFVAGDIDLNSRSGKLTANMLAVLAADYIENLSEEVKKGQHERLELGSFPFSPPIGYLPSGPDKIKRVDPIQGKLIKKCFELYGTGDWTIRNLATHMVNSGLKTTRGHKLDKNGLSRLLRNPFYIGIMKVKGRSYPGNHDKLVSPKLFERVQQILQRKQHKQFYRHYYLFKGILKCGYCGRILRCVFAKKKYHYYYCLQNNCQMRCVNEKKVEEYVLNRFLEIEFTDKETEAFRETLKQSKQMTNEHAENNIKGKKLALEQARLRLDKLIDLYLDGKIEEKEIEPKKEKTLFQIKNLEHEIASFEKSKGKNYERLEELGKLLKSPIESYKLASPDKKRRLVKSMLENFRLTPEKLDVDWKIPFDTVANREKDSWGGSDGTRTRNLFRACNPLFS